MEQFQRGRTKGAGPEKYHKAQHPQAPKLTESVQPRVLNPKDSTAHFLIQNSINSNGTIPARKSQRSWYEKYHKAKHRQGIGRAAWIEFWSRCKSVQVMQGNGVDRPARPVCDKPVSARTRWNLFGDRGVVQGGGTGSRQAPWQPPLRRCPPPAAVRLPWRRAGSEQRSESCH